MTHSRNIPRTARRIFAGILAVLFLLILISVLGLSTVGFPDWLVTKLTRRISTGNFVLNAAAIKLAPLQGLVLKDVYVYRKRVIGPAAVNAEKVILTLDPLAIIDKRIWLKKVTIREGVFRPKMARKRKPGVPSEFDAKIAVQFELELDKCEVQGLHLEKLSCEFLLDDSSMRLKSIKGTVSHCDLQDPELTGNATYCPDTGVLDGQVVTLFDPHLLLPVLFAWDMPFTAKLVKRFNFGETPPRCEAVFSHLYGTNELFRIAGKFCLEDCCTYKGVDILRGDSRINFAHCATNSVLSVDPVLLFREEGLVKGTFTVDFKRHIIDFDGISTIDPKALAKMIGTFTNDPMKDLRFDGPTRITANGVVDYRDSNLTDIEAAVESKGLGVRKYVTDECAFKMHMAGLTNTLSDIRGKIYGGNFTGSAQFVLPSGAMTNTRYMVEGKIRNAELEKLLASIMKEGDQDYRGRVSGHTKIEGLMGEGNNSRAVQGEGYVSIKDGRVFTFPLFGGFTDIMTKIIPGLDFILSQTDVKSEFKISDGKIHTGEVLIEGDVFSVNGRGNYYFNKNLDFKVQFKLLKEKTLGGKVAQFLTAPLSKILEFRLTGTLKKPRWYLRTFSKDMLKKLGLSETDGVGEE